MSSQTAAVRNDVVPRSSVAESQSELREAFGLPFDFWLRDVGGWKRLEVDEETTRSVGQHASEPMAELLEGVLHPGSEVTLADQGGPKGEYLLVIALRKAVQEPLVAVTKVFTSEPQWLLRLARSAAREQSRREIVEQLADENDAFAQQVTEDFEELTFLRQMAEYIEISDASNDLLQLTRSVLPLLLPSVKAQCVAFVPAEYRLQQDTAKEPEIGQTVFCHGVTQVDAEICRRLVEQHRRDAVDRPVVKNRILGSLTYRDCPDVTAFVLVQVAKDGHYYGWLLAMNRAAGYGYDGHVVRWLDSHLEFGTAEATLLGTAAAVLATQARNTELFREKERLLTNVVRALVSAIEAKDPYTCGHSERVAAMGRRLAHRRGLDQKDCDRIYLAGLLHDVGKIGVRDSTLRKTTRLTDEEFEEIKRHPDGGWAILHQLEALSYILSGVLYHHERFDGKGYPDGLAGEEIPIDGRILAVADAYDAMTSDRPYRTSMSQEKAEQILREGAGSHWDPQLVDVFLGSMADMVNIRSNYKQRDQVTRRHKSIEVESVAPNSDVTPTRSASEAE